MCFAKTYEHDLGDLYCASVRARINEELAKSNFDFFFVELNFICI